jgi:hypothetical protein
MVKLTTFSKLMKDKKICIIFNAATGCGHHKKHITQLVELDNKYGS